MSPAQSRETFLAARRTGIGGSDIAAIVGLNPHRSAFDVYAEKMGLVEHDDLAAENERLRWGKKLEQVIADEYSIRTGRSIQWFDQTVRHSIRDWQIGSPDALCLKDDEPGIDCKTAGVDQAWRWGDPGTDDIPNEYLLQGHWYMSITGRPQWDFPVLIGGNDFRIYTVRRDASLEGELIEQGEKFWRDHIEKRVPPPIDGSESASRYLKGRFPKNLYSLRTATPEELSHVLWLRSIREEFDKLEAQKKVAENRLKEMCGDWEGLDLGPDGKVTWRRSKDSISTSYEDVAKGLLSAIWLENPAERQKWEIVWTGLMQEFSEKKDGIRRLLYKAKGRE